MTRVGEYARVSDGVVYIYGFERGEYETVRMDRDEECTHYEHELKPWMPAPGEQVLESNNEESITGTVLTTNERTSLVKWEDSGEPEVWRNMQLEPLCV